MLQFSKIWRPSDEAWQAETGLTAALLHTVPQNDSWTSSAAATTLQPIRSCSLRISFAISTSLVNPTAQSLHKEDSSASS